MIDSDRSHAVLYVVSWGMLVSAVLLAATAFEVVIGWRRVRCAIRGMHANFKRAHALGGFRCDDCDFVGADVHDMGTLSEGYVSPLRGGMSFRADGVPEFVRSQRYVEQAE